MTLKQTRDGLFYRPNTADRNMLHDSNISNPKSDYATVDPKDKVIMDIGANIGGFARRALELGAQRIVCYEPLPSNIEVLRLNVENTPIELIEKCILGDDTPEITFYQNDSKLSHCSASIKAKKNAYEYQVPAINFWTELERIKPSLIKMDIEGAEYNVLHSDFPDYVKELAIEIHLSNKIFREKAADLISRLKAQFNEILLEKEEVVFDKIAAMKFHFKR